jgi:riboflavin kinase/FMN adenylyltransferase
MELHILDFSGNLYGKVLDLTIFERLRDEQYFAAKELLIRQIEMDLEQARRILDNT